MPKSARPDFRALLAARKTVFKAWLGLGSPLAVEIAADAGWDAVLIDQQHGAGGPAELLGCLTAAKAAGVPALVRVAQLDYGLTGRALDAGAQGVMVPMVETAEDAARLAHFVKYPPLGATEGFDMICIGPNDLAISISRGQDRDIGSPGMLETIEHVRQRAVAHGVVTAIFANGPEFAKRMMETGWQVISVGTDTGWLAAAARQMLPV